MRKEIEAADLEVFSRYDWDGGTRTYGDVSDSMEFTAEDVAEVIASAKTPDDWDGIEAAVFRLNDGRFVAYESTWGPTGSGFSADAYGGDAVVTFTADLNTALLWGITDEGRRLLQVEPPGQQEGGSEDGG